MSEVDRQYLEGLLKKGQMKARAYKRVQGLLELDRGLSMGEIAKSIKVVRSTLTRWEKRYH
ncbi:MAG: helix-turn-helix domain-containing protein [Cyanobacteria bacterium J06643_4]